MGDDTLGPETVSPDFDDTGLPRTHGPPEAAGRALGPGDRLGRYSIVSRLGAGTGGGTPHGLYVGLDGTVRYASPGL